MTLVAASCTDPTPAVTDGTVGPRDASFDAAEAPTRTATVRLEDARARVSLTAGPRGVALRVERPDGSLWFASPDNGSFLEVGTAKGGPDPARAPDTRSAEPAGITWETPAYVIDENAAEGAVTFSLGAAGPVRVSLSRVEEGVYRVAVEATGRDAAMLRLSLAADAGQYHGLGERFGDPDARGSVVPMQFGIDGTSASGTNEFHVPVPFFVSTRAYGMFVKTLAPGAFDVASSDPTRVRATFDTARAETLVFVGPRPADVVAAYTRQSGLPRLPPRWVYGPMHWRNEWRNRDELFEDVRRLRAERVPATTVWIDNPWQRSYNDADFDTTRFPDPPGMFAELTRMGFKVLVWHTPYLDAVAPGAQPANPAERLYVQARDAGHLVRLRATNEPYVSISSPGGAGGMPDSNGAMIDFTSPAASAFWTSRLAPLVDLGVRGFKLDYGEDIVTDILGARPGFVFASGDDERNGHALYPQGYHRAYQAAFEQRSAGDGFLLVRGSSWGGQRVADVVWPGDLDNDFRRAETVNGRRQVGGLPASVHALVSLAASGFPNYGADTGGYRGGRPTREVLLRWAEHTALSPVLQLGGGGESHNPWSYTPDATDAYRALARLHNDLVPYLYGAAQRASRDGTPAVLSLPLAFPDDPGSLRDRDAYLLGDDLYVAPVLTAGATSRAVHIPPGVWVHGVTRRAYTGPADVTVDAPLGSPTYFVRRGAMIPRIDGAIDTLASTDDAAVVDAADRGRILRPWIVPAGEHSTEVYEGARVAVREGDDALRVTFTPGREYSDFRAEIDVTNRGSSRAPAPTAVTRDGAPLRRVDTAAEALAGCDGCWHYDAARGVLSVGVVGAAAVEAR